MDEDWIQRWESGQTGWHEASGNRNLQRHWKLTGKRVLVPLCGKSPDLLWLESQGNSVTGIELSEIAVEAFFEENALQYKRADTSLPGYRCTTRDLTLYCGDYFQFRDETFDAHYDRGALVALPPDLRPRYVEHTSSLLSKHPDQFVVTVEYDQRVCAGPPFSVEGGELLSYWPALREIARVPDLENGPPKFVKAGLTSMDEVVWAS